MVYAYDQWAQMPVKDLYDSQMMAIIINAAKDQYNNAKEELKEFRKNYNDFYTPILSQQRAYNNIIGGVTEEINRAYANGEDLLRSQAGRAKLLNLISSVPVSEIARIKRNAEYAKEFAKNRGSLQREGRYSPELERQQLGGKLMEEFGVNDDFVETSPIQYKTLQEFVHPSLEGIGDRLLTEQEVADQGYQYDPRFEWYGKRKSDAETILSKTLPGLAGSPYYRFYRNKAYEDLLREGNINPTQDQIDRKLVENSIQADSQIFTPIKREADPFKRMDYEAMLSRQTHAINAAIDHKYWLQEHDPGNNDDLKNVFREADTNLNNRYSQLKNSKGAAAVTSVEGVSAGFDPTTTYYQYIDPVDDGMSRIETGGVEGWVVDPTKLEKYNIYSNNNRHLKSMPEETKPLVFVPNGRLKARYEYDGNTKLYNRIYRINGTLYNPGDTKDAGAKIRKQDVWMNVRERGGNYGIRQKNKGE